MKKWKIMAWTGIGFFAIGTVTGIGVMIALIDWNPGPQPGFGPESFWPFVIYPVDVIGLVLMYIGGLKSRPRYYLIASITLGVMQIVSFLQPEWAFINEIVLEKGILAAISHFWPGLTAVLFGVLLLVINRVSRKRTNKEVQ